MKSMAVQLDALEIVFTAPLWPRREDLTPAGMALHDAIVRWAKPYVVARAMGRYWLATRLLARSAPLLHALMDDRAAIGTDARRLMLAVWLHYARAVADFSKLQ